MTSVTRQRVLGRRWAGTRICWCAALLALGSVASGSPPLPDLSGAIGRLEGHGLTIVGTAITLVAVGGETWGVEVKADEFRSEALGVSLLRISVTCPELIVEAQQVRCEDGRLSFRHDGQPATIPVAFAWTPQSTRVEIGPAVTPFGRLHLISHQRGDQASLELDVSTPNLADSPALLALAGLPDNVTVDSGGFEFSLDYTGGRGRYALGIDSLTGSDESGLRAVEDLSATVQGTFSFDDPKWRFDMTAELIQGAAIYDSFYIEASTPAQSLVIDGQWDPQQRRLALDRGRFVHSGVVDVTATAELELSPVVRIESLAVRLPSTQLAPLYKTYLKALAWETLLEAIEVEGRIALDLDWREAGHGSADIALDRVSFEDDDGSFGVYGLDADLHWRSSDPGPMSRIAWEGASVRAIDLDAARIDGDWLGNGFSMREAVSIPVLDGIVKLNRFELRRDESGGVGWVTSAAILPIPLESLTSALGWPPFSGTLAGGIPEIRYEDGRISTAGAIVINVFDGDVVVTDLTVDQPLQDVPVVRGNVDIWGLSLAQLTRAFSFGDIQGRLDGKVHNLVLESWQPVSFDARFATPPHDDSRHRISQNAVDSLASLGGSSGVLSSTFLGFLETFSYDRLGVSCRLSNGVCSMGGVAPAARGYYIVKGGGLPPRIDVLGFNDRVAWDTLVERLANITRSGGPIIE